jgi:CelD/BcsL family acetyltransferase involved in cellulose biosynthesis
MPAPATLRGGGSRAWMDTAPLPPGLALRHFTDFDDFLALKPQWLALEDDAARPLAVFQSFGWLAGWAATYRPGNHRQAVSVFAGYRNDRLVFAMALMQKKRGGICELRWLSEPLAQYGDVLAARGEDPAFWIEHVLADVVRQHHADVVRLRHVRDDAVASPYLRSRFRSARLNEGAPHMDLTQFDSEDDYERRYSKEQRKRRKKIRRCLEELGEVVFTPDESAGARGAVIDDAVRHKRTWLKERRLFSPGLACPRIGEFLKNLDRECSGDFRVVMSALRAGGRPVSWEVGLRYRGRHFGYITAHDNALTDLSPARLHMDLSQRQALKDGCNVFDLMVPNDPHKESWASAVTPVEDYYLPVTLAGRLYGEIYLARVRPLIRRLYYESNAGLRSKLGMLGMMLGHGGL